MQNQKIPTHIGTVIIIIIAITVGTFVYILEKEQWKNIDAQNSIINQTKMADKNNNSNDGSNTSSEKMTKEKCESQYGQWTTISWSRLADGSGGGQTNSCLCANKNKIAEGKNESCINESDQLINDLMIYRNNKYKFEFEYPKTFYSKSCEDSYIGFSKNKTKADNTCCGCDSYPLDINMIIYANYGKEAKSNFDQMMGFPDRYYSLDTFSETPIIIDGKINGYKIDGITRETDGPGVAAGIKTSIVLFLKDDIIYEFRYYEFNNEDYKNYFDQLVSSIKFDEASVSSMTKERCEKEGGVWTKILGGNYEQNNVGYKACSCLKDEKDNSKIILENSQIECTTKPLPKIKTECEKLEEKVKLALVKNDYCKLDSDCSYIVSNCSFLDHYILINKNEEKNANDLDATCQKECDVRLWELDCDIKKLRCIQGKCIMEFEPKSC